MLANLRALFGVVVDIVLWRRGPEQLPASPALLACVVALSIVGSALMCLVTPTSLASALAQGMVGAGVMLLWFRTALTLAGKRERFLQTATAIFGVNVLFVPAMVPLVGAVMPYMQKADPNVPPPAALLIVTFAIGLWAFLVEMRIVRAAFECAWFAAFLLVIGEILAAGFVGMLLFGEPPSAN